MFQKKQKNVEKCSKSDIMKVIYWQKPKHI